MGPSRQVSLKATAETSKALGRGFDSHGEKFIKFIKSKISRYECSNVMRNY